MIFLPVAFAFDGGDLTALTLGVQVTVHSPSGGDSHGITTLLLQKLDRAEVLATERTLNRLLPLSFLMVCPDFHTFDVNAITTTKPVKKKKNQVLSRINKLTLCHYIAFQSSIISNNFIRKLNQSIIIL